MDEYGNLVEGQTDDRPSNRLTIPLWMAKAAPGMFGQMRDSGMAYDFRTPEEKRDYQVSVANAAEKRLMDERAVDGGWGSDMYLGGGYVRPTDQEKQIAFILRQYASDPAAIDALFGR